MDKLERVGGIIDSMIAFSDTEAGPSADIVQLVFVAESGREFQRIARLLKRISPTGSLFGPAQDILPRCTQDSESHRLAHSLRPGRESWGLALPNRTPREGDPQDRRPPTLCLDRFPGGVVHPRYRLVKTPEYRVQLDLPRSGGYASGTCSAGRTVPSFSAHGDGGTLGSIYDPPRPVVMIRVPAHSPGERQKLELELSRLPGVKLVRPSIWGPSRWYPYWATGVIAARSPPKGTQPSVAERRALPPKRPS